MLIKDKLMYKPGIDCISMQKNILSNYYQIFDVYTLYSE